MPFVARSIRMVLLTAGLALLLVPGAAAQTRLYPGWSQIPVANASDAVEIGFKCVGEECARDTLQCVYFRRTVTMPEGTRSEDLAGEIFTWPQFEYWLARRYLDERHDVAAGLETISSGRRVEPPSVKRSRDMPYVATAYAAKVYDWEARFPVALWVRGGEIRGLRCSYRADESDDPTGKIAQLLELVITQ